MQELVDYLKKTGYLKTSTIIEAFLRVDRRNFVPLELKGKAYVDMALPIGHDQTISQPAVVAFMLELLEVKPSQNILEVGAGSGWQTALLAELVGPEGRIVAIERIGELFKMAQKNLRIQPPRFSRPDLGRGPSTSGVGVVELVLGDGSKGWPGRAPYDRIIAAATAQEIPKKWQEQLKIGGKMVFPMGWSIYEVEKKGEDNFKINSYPGFVFVPLIND